MVTRPEDARGVDFLADALQQLDKVEVELGFDERSRVLQLLHLVELRLGSLSNQTSARNIFFDTLLVNVDKDWQFS